MTDDSLPRARTSHVETLRRYAPVVWVVARSAGLTVPAAENLTFLALVRWAQQRRDSLDTLRWARETSRHSARRPELASRESSELMTLTGLLARLAVQFPWLTWEERAAAAGTPLEHIRHATDVAVGQLAIAFPPSELVGGE